MTKQNNTKCAAALEAQPVCVCVCVCVCMRERERETENKRDYIRG